MNTSRPSARKVADWVETLKLPMPEYDREGRRELRRMQERARGQLASWGLDGEPLAACKENDHE